MKKIATLLGVSAVLATSAITAVPAHADVYRCPTSNACFYKDLSWTGTYQNISGFAPYTDLNGSLANEATSWINANNSQAMAIGEWRSGQQFLAQILYAGWTDNDLRDIGFNDKADFTRQA